jgi:hypothetical protein
VTGSTSIEVLKKSQESSASESSVQAATATQLLHLKPYKFTVVQKLQEARCDIMVWFCNWFCEAVCSGEVDPLLNYITNRQGFT